MVQAPSTKRNRLYFGAGPAKLPPPVLSTIRSDMFNIAATNLSIFELSHRSKEYQKINKRAIEGLSRLIGITDDSHVVLLVPGGATLQFAASVLNVNARRPITASIDYLITGYWSEKAADEAQRLGLPVKRIQCVSIQTDDHGNPQHIITLPSMDTLSDTVYYCQNETIDGVELPELEPARPTQYLLCDASSNILSRPLNPKNYAVLFAGAQKNVGVAGVTIVMARRDLVVGGDNNNLPSMVDYYEHYKNDSIYNTPPMVAVYGTALVVEWLASEFGTLHAIDSFSQRKAALLYSLLDTTSSHYNPIHPARFRSRINVIMKPKIHCKEEEEEKLIGAAAEHGIEGIQGHRSTGGLRISLYNSITEAEVRELCDFLKKRLQ